MTRMKPAISGRWAATAKPIPLAAVVLLWSAAGSLAGEADVIAVTAHPRAPGVYDFDVTVRSHDTGWDHYADRLEAVAPDGRLLGTRALLHPHDDEQPFTRDISGVRVPTGIDRVTVRARYKPGGYDGATVTVTLPPS